MTKGKWRKKILAGFLGILALAALSGCQESLSDEFQEDQVIAEAKEMVERINAGELEGVWEDTFNVVMQNGTDPEELQENIDYYMIKENFRTLTGSRSGGSQIGTQELLMLQLWSWRLMKTEKSCLPFPLTPI